MNTVVTRIDNIQRDEDGNFLFDDDGVPKLNNEEDVGILIKTHVVQVNQVIDGVIQSGLSPLSEVLWNERRNPAPDLVAPADLVWLTIDSNQDDEGLENDDTQVTDDIYEEEQLSFQDQ